MEILRTARTRYRVAKGGRGSGKSYGIAQRFIIYALTEPGVRLLCTRETQNSLSESALAIMKRVITDHGLEAAFVQTKHGLMCRNGAEFVFRGLQHPGRIQSLDNIKYCWIEEAHNVTQEAWDILIPTIRADGSEIWVSYNPDLETDPVHQMFVVKGRPDATVVTVNWPDNPFFPASLQRELEYDRSTDTDKYLHIWEGEPRKASKAQVFAGKWRIGDAAPAEKRVYYYGADWGFSQDPSVLVRCFIEDERLYIDHEAYAVGVDIDELPALFRNVPDAEKWTIIADSARPETISYMAKNGWKMRGAKKGKGSVEDGIAFLRSFREIVVAPSCKHVIDSMKLYSYKVDRLTGEPTPELDHKSSDCIDALRYSVEPIIKGGILSAAQISAGDFGL